jgi:hypothetical protein
VGSIAHRRPRGEADEEPHVTLTRDEAAARIDELQLANEAACDLAHLASLAARAEPELLRKLRIDVLPSVSASAEADLWFSDVAGARSTSWLLLRPEVAELMRKQVAARFDDERLTRARSIIAIAHEKASPLVQLEDEIHWLTMRGDMKAVDAKLEVLVKALRSPNAEAAARWTIRAMPRFSNVVRARPGAWLARFIAEQHLGESVRFEPGTESVPPEVWPLVRGALSSTDVWVRMIPAGVEFSREPLIGARRITAPLTEPVVVEIERSSERERITIPREGVVQAKASGSITMRTIDGARHVLKTTETTPRDAVEIRWALVANMMDESRYAGLEENLRQLDVVFVAGDVSREGKGEDFRLAHDRLVLGRPGTPILAVPGNHDLVRGAEEPFANFLEFAQRFPAPRYFKRGQQPGDFAATLDIKGVRIGVVGLNTTWDGDRPRLDWSQIEVLCGREPEEWSERHHLTILLAHYSLARAIRNDADIARVRRLFAAEMISNEVVAGDLSTRLDILPRSAEQSVSPRFGSPNADGTISVGAREAWMTLNVSGYPIHESQRLLLALHEPMTQRELVAPERWILIAGSAKASSRIAAVAREVGAALANAGYGLLTGGWPGVDAEATAGFAAAHLASPEELQEVIHHYVARIEPKLSVPGRRLFFESDHAAVEKSVTDADAVVLIAGLAGTEWIGEEAIRQQRPLIPIIATGGAARRFAGVFASLRNEEAPAVTLARNVINEIEGALHDSKSELLDPTKTFETFPVNRLNQDAYHAASGIARGTSREPIVIVGPPGTGKSHLLMGIADYVSKTIDEGKLVYVRGEHATTRNFFRAFESAEVLLVKSVDSASPEAQEELMRMLHEWRGQKRKQFAATAQRLTGPLAKLVAVAIDTPRLPITKAPKKVGRPKAKRRRRPLLKR